MQHASCLLVLLHTACSLKDHVLEGQLTQETMARIRNNERFEMPLENSDDVQYFGKIKVGKRGYGKNQRSQVLKGIMDTGSFELVAFGKSCFGCGRAGRYWKGSKSWRKGQLVKTQAYGSGDCVCWDGTDDVAVGEDDSDTGDIAVKAQAEKQHLWVAQHCRMPLLQQASFNAIVGLGPPGQPAYSARERVKEAANQLNPMPLGMGPSLLQAKNELKVAEENKDLLENLNVQVFSQCLTKRPGGPGYFVWNDVVPPNAKGLKVYGNITWSTSCNSWNLGKKTVGCDKGCAALVDTGTSLFGVPSDVWNAMDQELQKSGGDCKDLSSFPDLTMELDGQKLTFPPSSYLGYMYGLMNKEVARFLRPRNRSLSLNRGETSTCELLVMDLGTSQETTLGPMVILGMPAFRHYCFTFDTFDGYRSDGKTYKRKIYVTRSVEKDGKCGPAPAGAQLTMDEAHRQEANTPRHIDASKLRLPSWVDRWQHGI